MDTLFTLSEPEDHTVPGAINGTCQVQTGLVNVVPVNETGLSDIARLVRDSVQKGVTIAVKEATAPLIKEVQSTMTSVLHCIMSVI